MRQMKLPLQKMFGLSISESVFNRYLSVLYGGDNLTFSDKVNVSHAVSMDIDVLKSFVNPD